MQVKFTQQRFRSRQFGLGGLAAGNAGLGQQSAERRMNGAGRFVSVGKGGSQDSQVKHMQQQDELT